MLDLQKKSCHESLDLHMFRDILTRSLRTFLVGTIAVVGSSLGSSLSASSWVEAYQRCSQ